MFSSYLLQAILDACMSLCPSFLYLRSYSIAIEPETSTQQPDLVKALDILCLEDPSLVVEYDKESGQTLIKGIGELHLDIVCDKLKRQYNISVFASRTYIGFRETIASVGEEGLVKSFM